MWLSKPQQPRVQFSTFASPQKNTVGLASGNKVDSNRTWAAHIRGGNLPRSGVHTAGHLVKGAAPDQVGMTRQEAAARSTLRERAEATWSPSLPLDGRRLIPAGHLGSVLSPAGDPTPGICPKARSSRGGLRQSALDRHRSQFPPPAPLRSAPVWSTPHTERAARRTNRQRATLGKNDNSP